MFAVGAPGVNIRAGRVRAILVGTVIGLGAVCVPFGAASVGAQTTTQVSTTVAAPAVGSTATTVAGAPAVSAAKPATSVNDRSSTRKVQLIVGALTALGLLFGVLVAMYWRATKPLPAHFEGLDLLATRKFQNAPDETREVLLANLDAQRPEVSEVEIVPDAQLLPDGHVGELVGEHVDESGEVEVPTYTPSAFAEEPSSVDSAVTELGRSNGAPFVAAPPTYTPAQPEPIRLRAAAAGVSPAASVPPPPVGVPPVALPPVVPPPVVPHQYVSDVEAE
jgi:hypothetical protein